MDAISTALETSGRLLPSIECRLNEPMKNHTSFRIGGPVRAMFLPKSEAELTELCTVLRDSGVRPLIMGNGTNLLADDKPLDLIVAKTSGLGNIELTSEAEITAESGVIISKLAMFACESGLSGLEFAHGIPGTLGGAVTMNAGAYGGEMKDVIQATTALNPETGMFFVTGDEHGFSYRHSRFSDKEDIILSSVIRLRKDDSAKIRARMDELSQRRRESQPLDLPSAGSTFKRPKDGYAAALIDQAGLKGFTIGGAAVSEKHAGFIVNRGDASFDDVMAVIEHVRETVLGTTGIELETEIKTIR
jgi:UDP-N-acetylmuramate dehydrogenase